MQVWLPAPGYAAGAAGGLQPQPGRLSVVIKTYPLLSWLWTGLVLVLTGALLRALAVWR